MAVAAAAAARAAATSLAEKQYTSALKTVDNLKDVTYSKYRDQIERVAYACDWHDSILDQSIDEPDGALSTKDSLDRKNAYMILMTKTDGSEVEDVLHDCQRGAARHGFNLVNEHYHRSTAAGRGEATAAFYTSTMESTGTTILQWCALVSRNASILKKLGATVDEEAQLVQLCSGLLPEFEFKRLQIEDDETMTVAKARQKLMDYAKTKKLTTLTKGGTSIGRHHTYNAAANTVDDRGRGGGKGGKGGKAGKGGGGKGGKGGKGSNTKPPVEDCRNFANGNCYYRNCRFNHPGEVKTTGGADATKPSVNLTDASGDDLPMINSTFNVSVSAPAQERHSSTVASGDTRLRSPSPAYIDTMQLLGNDVTTIEPNEFETEPDPHPPARSMIPSAAAIVFAIIAISTIVAECFFSVCKKTANVCFRALGKLTHGAGLSVVATIIAVGILWFSIAAAMATPTDFVNTSMYHGRASVFAGSTNHEPIEAGYEWCSDSGTNRFVTNDEDDFVPGSIKQITTIVAVGGGNVTSTKSGTVIVQSLDRNRTITCNNVLLMPNCAKKLMPASTFVKKGCSLAFCNYTEVYLTNAADETLLNGKAIDGLYFFHCKTLPGNAKSGHDAAQHHTIIDGAPASRASTYFGLKPGKITASAQDFPKQLYEAHCAYGHVHFDKLRKLLGLKKGDNPDCEACTISKSRAEALSGQTYERSARRGHRVHMDLGFTANNDFVFQLYVDDYDRYTDIDVMVSKANCLADWIKLKDTIENDIYPAKLSFIRTDSEPCYQTPEWKAWCEKNNIRHEFSTRHRHDQHGVAERSMQSVGITFRAQMHQGNAPACDIPDALRHSVMIKNNTPTKANNGWTPREKRAGMRLPINQKLLRGPLFCLVYAHVYEAERSKHAPRGIASVYLGYDQINNCFLVKEWVSGQRYYTADLTFHPSTFPYRANPQRTIGNLEQYDDAAPHLTSQLARIEAVPAKRGKSTRVSGYQHSGGVDLRAVPDEDVPPPAAVHMVHNFGPDPESMKEARQMFDAEDWIEAEIDEKNSFKHHGVYTAVLRSDVPKGKRVFKAKPILRRKMHPPDEFNPNGTIDKCKFRLTIAAYTKMLKEGIDYEEKHASTVRWNAIKILIAIAVKFDLDITAIDISTFFLYGELEEEMYMEIPDGWEENDNTAGEWVWLLNKSVYGMPQAGNCAQKVLKKTITAEEEFVPTSSDDCVYVSTKDDTGYAATGTHVDDLMSVGDTIGIQKLIHTLEKKFEITVKKNPTIFCGVQIHRVREHKWLKLHQQAYTQGLVADYQMSACNPVDTPMDPGTAKHLMLLSTDGASAASIKAYQKIVGSLMWLLKTRPDMHYTINLLARFLKCATDDHVAIATGRPLKYLAHTSDFGIVYAPGEKDWELSGAADSDLAGDLRSARSTAGTTTQLGEYGNISCSSKLDKKISTSTGQGETYAFQELCKEIIWDRHLLRELGYGQSKPTPSRTDNDGVLIQSTKPVNHAAAKHYRIAQAFIRMLTAGKEVKVLRVPTDFNQSDTLTKPLAKVLFQRHRLAIMGPQQPPGLD